MYLLQHNNNFKKGVDLYHLIGFCGHSLMVGLGYIWIVSYLDSVLKCHKNVCDCMAAVVSFTLFAFLSQNILTFLLSCYYREVRLGIKTLETFYIFSTKRFAAH
jgi:hypothetical protein